MILTVRLLPREAKALREMCKRFRFDDAQHLLTGARNVSATNLCEAVTSIYQCLTRRRPAGGEASRLTSAVTAETDTHVTVSLAIEKSQVVPHRRFLESLVKAFDNTMDLLEQLRELVDAAKWRVVVAMSNVYAEDGSVFGPTVVKG